MTTTDQPQATHALEQLLSIIEGGNARSVKESYLIALANQVRGQYAPCELEVGDLFHVEDNRR